MLEIAGNPHLLQDEEDDAGRSISRLIQHVGDSVRDRRKALRISRRELSERSGVSPRYLAKLEGGDGNISIGLLKKVALALDTPIELLLADHGELSAETHHMSELYRRADAATRTKVMEILDPDRMREQKADRLCLVGLRGAGKSTLGLKISKEFGAPFVELNQQIETNAGMPVGEIIALYGQEGYRQLEADALTAIIETQGCAVVAVAGGIVSEEQTFYHLLSRFHTVWVKASASEHMDRVRAQGDVRPMEGNPQAMIQLRQILKAREAQYARADHVLDTSGKSVDQSLSELSDLVGSFEILGPSPI